MDPSCCKMVQLTWLSESLCQEECVVINISVVHARSDVARDELGIQLFNCHLGKQLGGIWVAGIHF